MSHTLTIFLTVATPYREEAHAIAVNACEHLADTFNDDGSISATIAPLNNSEDNQHAMADLLGQFVAWGNDDAPDGRVLQVLIQDAAALLEHGPAASKAPAIVGDQTCYDIMCTATEGGINYWCDILKRKGQGRLDSSIPDIISFEAKVQDGPITCDHPDIEGAEIDVFTCDPDMIRKGIERLLAPGAKVASTIRDDVLRQATDPDNACDADSADAIVQFGVFGELVFG